MIITRSPTQANPLSTSYGWLGFVDLIVAIVLLLIFIFWLVSDSSKRSSRGEEEKKQAAATKAKAPDTFDTTQLKRRS